MSHPENRRERTPEELLAASKAGENVSDAEFSRFSGAEFAPTPTADEANPGRTTGGGAVIHIEQTFNGPADPKKVQDATHSGVQSGMKEAATQHRDAYDSARVGAPTYSSVGEGESSTPGP